MIHFDEDVAGVLRSSGWSPSDVKPVAEWEAFYRAKGIEFHEAALEALRVLGGLRVGSAGREGVKFKPMSFSFRLDRVRNPGLYKLADWAREGTGIKLCPIGEWEDGLTGIFIDANGATYLSTGETLFLVGATLNDGLRSLMFARDELEVIDYPDK